MLPVCGGIHGLWTRGEGQDRVHPRRVVNEVLFADWSERPLRRAIRTILIGDALVAICAVVAASAVSLELWLEQ